ncbi:MAG: amidohydrolase family protein, partial [Oscillospiraceae bacterium]
LIDKMSTTPSRIINIGRGNLGVGSPADIVIFDTENEFTVDVDAFKSKGKNSPYDGFKLFGEVKKTITNGKVVYSK